MSWKALNEVYFVKPEEIKASHLIPEHLRKQMVDLMTGIVTHVGTGTLLESGNRAPLQAVEGDRVLFGTNVGKEIEVDGEKLLMLAEANVLAMEVKNG